MQRRVIALHPCAIMSSIYLNIHTCLVRFRAPCRTRGRSRLGTRHRQALSTRLICNRCIHITSSVERAALEVALNDAPFCGVDDPENSTPHRRHRQHPLCSTQGFVVPYGGHAQALNPANSINHGEYWCLCQCCSIAFVFSDEQVGVHSPRFDAHQLAGTRV